MRNEIIVTLEIENRKSHPVTKRVPRGSLVEIADPRSDEQHAMVVRDYIITIPPKSTSTVHMEALCFAKRRSWPQGTRGYLTPYAFSGIVLNQQDLWGQFGY